MRRSVHRPDRRGRGCARLTTPSGDAYNSWDLYASYILRSSVGRTALAAGVNNVFKHPAADDLRLLLAHLRPDGVRFHRKGLLRPVGAAIRMTRVAHTS